MKKKILSCLLIVTLIMSLFSELDIISVTVKATDILRWGNYEYISETEGEITVTSYLGKEKNVVIPSEINGLPVTEIGDYCFSGNDRRVFYNGEEYENHPNRFYNKRIRSVTIPPTVRTIGEYAFCSMIRLKEVVFSEGLITIEDYAFESCSALEEINLPQSLVNFTLLSFEKTKIEEIVLGKNVACPVFVENEGSKIKRIVCNAESVLFEEVVIGEKTTLEEIVCNGTFRGGKFGKYSYIKRIVCVGDMNYSTVISMLSHSFDLCYDIGGNIVFGHVIFDRENKKSNKIHESSGYEYYINANNEAVVTRYTGSENEISIPSTFNGKKVTEIAPFAFSLDCSPSMKCASVTIPDTVKKIGYCAFAYNKFIESVTLSRNIKKIPNECFYNCKSLNSLSLTENIEEIGNSAFRLCESLESISFQCRLEKIGDWAFYKCKLLKDINLPDITTGIGNNAFDDCESLETVTMKGIVRIGNYAFYQCRKLKDIGDVGKLEEIGEYAFDTCKFDGTLELPSILKIGNNAFFACIKLDKVILNDKLTVLEDGVFARCYELKEINFPSELISIGGHCFYETIINSVDFGEKLKEICSGAFAYSALEGTIDLSAVEKIDRGAFASNYGIEEVILNDNMQNLEYGTFQNCTRLKKINFPSALVSIDSYCFTGTAISTAFFGNKLKLIGAGAFRNCTELKEIELPESIEKIGIFAFEATAIRVLTIPENLSVIGYGSFKNCKDLEILYFNAKKCTVDKYMNEGGDIDIGNLQDSAPFYGCNIKEVYLGAGITAIGRISDTHGAFENCTELESIIIPDTVSEIGKASFKNCSSLELAVISDSVTIVADDAFDGCESLTILCFEGSYIYEYAQNNGIAVSTFLVSPIPNQTYTGKKITPPVTVTFSGETLHKYIDFGVTYANNINAGEADVIVKGRGDYKAFSNRTKFTIVTKSIVSATISSIADQPYTGKEITPDVKVTDSLGILCRDKDYTVSYSGNKKEGTATVIVTGIGNYSGTLSAEFKIIKMSDVDDPDDTEKPGGTQKPNNTETFFSRLGASIKAFFVRVGAFFKGLFSW